MRKLQQALSERTATSFALAILASAAAAALLVDGRPVRAQQAAPLAVTSISVGPDQAVNYPNAGPSTYLLDFPDEHMTFLPPASTSSPYLLFGSSSVSGTTPGQAVALESTDLITFKFATDLGYNPLVMTTPAGFTGCSPTYDSEFDETYAGPVFVAQDPTLPAGNLLMLYEAENHCPGGVGNLSDGYASTGFTRSSDNGKTWPAPDNGWTGGSNRYAVIQPAAPPPTTPQPTIGTLAEAGYVDKSSDGNYYLYALYEYFNSTEPEFRIARAPLGQNHLTFKKWYNGAFSQPGLGGTDSVLVPNPCGGHGGQPSLSYVDDANLYLLTFVCFTSNSSAWYYSTATSLDLEDWSTPQIVQNSQFPVTSTASCSPITDGFYPSFVSPGAAANHLKAAGKVFLLDGCLLGNRTLTSRTFTITVGPAPPVLTAGTLANGATYASGGLVPGSWAQVKGKNLANVANYVWQGSDFTGLGNKLPTNLKGASITVNGVPAALYYADASQVNFQVPSGVSGTASVQVTNNGLASNTITAAIANNAPGIFPIVVNGVNYAGGVFLDGHYVGDPAIGPAFRKAKAGDIIELFATGLSPEPAGVLANYTVINGVTVTIGSVTFPADAAALVAVGEFQINFTVPQQFATLAEGNYPIAIAVNGVASPAAINSVPPGPVVIPIQH